MQKQECERNVLKKAGVPFSGKKGSNCGWCRFATLTRCVISLEALVPEWLPDALQSSFCLCQKVAQNPLFVLAWLLITSTIDMLLWSTMTRKKERIQYWKLAQKMPFEQYVTVTMVTQKMDEAETQVLE